MILFICISYFKTLLSRVSFYMNVGNVVRSSTRSLWSSSATNSFKMRLLPRLVVLSLFFASKITSRCISVWHSAWTYMGLLLGEVLGKVGMIKVSPSVQKCFKTPFPMQSSGAITVVHIQCRLEVSSV